jgi:serine/threonine protein kinase
MRKADVWAIGCVVYELCTGGEPLFSWGTEREKYMALASVYDASWQSPRLPACSSSWQSVLDAMLAVNSNDRLLPEEILKMEIFECVSCWSVSPVAIMWLP